MFTAILLTATIYQCAPLPRSVADRALFDGHWEIEECWNEGERTIFVDRPDLIIFRSNSFTWKIYLGSVYKDIEGTWKIQRIGSLDKIQFLVDEDKSGNLSTYGQGLYRFADGKLMLVVHRKKLPPHWGGAGSKESEFTLLILRRRKERPE